MPALPDGDPAPADGALPDGLDWDRPLRAYIHVPFCASRCGYCDFNTYTAGELGGFRFDAYVEAVRQEIALAARRDPAATAGLGLHRRWHPVAAAGRGSGGDPDCRARHLRCGARC